MIDCLDADLVNRPVVADRDRTVLAPLMSCPPGFLVMKIGNAQSAAWAAIAIENCNRGSVKAPEL